MAIDSKIGRPRKYTNPEDMQRDIDAYFESCWEHDEDGNRTKRKSAYTMSGLALALDMSRETLLRYKEKDDFSESLKKAKIRIQKYVEDYLFTGSRTAGAIFNLKNNFGWVDKQVVENEGEIKVTIQRFTDSADDVSKDHANAATTTGNNRKSDNECHSGKCGNNGNNCNCSDKDR